MKYNVHLFEIVRVKVGNVEADSVDEAIEKAEGEIDPHRLFGCGPSLEGEEIEWAEETAYFLVDPLDDNGEPDFEKSKWISGCFQI